MLQLFFCTLLLLLASPVRAGFGDPDTGLILHGDNDGTRSGILGHNHQCTEFPQHFPASRIENIGSIHCTLYANADCTGLHHIVPAHYGTDMPNETFASIMC